MFLGKNHSEMPFHPDSLKIGGAMSLLTVAWLSECSPSLAGRAARATVLSDPHASCDPFGFLGEQNILFQSRVRHVAAACALSFIFLPMTSQVASAVSVGASGQASAGAFLGGKSVLINLCLHGSLAEYLGPERPFTTHGTEIPPVAETQIPRRKDVH